MTEGVLADVLVDPVRSRDRAYVALHEVVRPEGLRAPHGLTCKDVIIQFGEVALATAADV